MLSMIASTRSVKKSLGKRFQFARMSTRSATPGHARKGSARGDLQWAPRYSEKCLGTVDGATSVTCAAST
eukprot:2841924-Pyramimonas_sp.AAC.1